MEYKDYYQTLGIEKDASPEDIKKAYRKLVRQHHPDLSRAKDADLKTKEINEAYAVLSDPEKRAAYDGLGSNMHAGQPFQPPPGWDAGGFGTASDEDFFADLFAHIGRRGRPGRFPTRGDDVHASLSISLADVYHGATRKVSLRSAGRERTLEVRIPQGVVPGQHIRLAGQGHEGVQGGPPGDLVLALEIAPDPHYRIEGRNVLRALPVAPWEAALGAHIEVATPSGQVQVAVPPGSQHGRKLRLKGRGIPGHPAGDLYLVLEVVLPPASSARARELYQAMAREMAFNPREAGA